MYRRLLPSLLISAALLPAAKKPITLDVVAESTRGDGGGQPVWAPGGKRFVYLKGKRMMLYDVPAKSERELIALEPLEKAATNVPPEVRFDWQNRRVRESSFQWSDSGKEILLSIQGDLFLWHMDSAKWDQLTATPLPETDAQLSPDASHVAFRRGHDLYSLEIASKKTERLTSDGSPTLLNAELDWVYPEELNLGTAFWWSPDSKRIAYLQFDIGHEFQYPHVDLKGRRAVLELERYPQAGTPNADVRLGTVLAGGRPHHLDGFGRNARSSCWLG